MIAYSDDRFKNPPFQPDYVTPTTEDIVEKKFEMMQCHVSQFYEWLPYSKGFLAEVPTGDAQRYEWLKTPRYSAEDIRLAMEGNSRAMNGECRFAVPATRFREKLISQYGTEKGSEIRFAEAFMLSEYSGKRSPEVLKELFCI